MTLFNTMYAALKGLVDDRVYEDNFPQMPIVPVVPAIRINLISGQVYPDICGNDFPTGDPLYQIDVIHATAHERNALVLQVSDAMNALVNPAAILQGLPNNDFDSQTKRYRANLDYVFYPSTAP